MELSIERLLLTIVIFLVICKEASAFNSDELENDEEWGLVGGRSAEPDFIAPTSPKISRASTRVVPENSPTDSKLQFPVEHAFGNSNFSVSGHFTARLKASPHGGQTLTKVRVTRNPLTESEQRAFEELLREDDFYRIRMPANVLTPGKDYVLSSVKARCLAKSDLEERFIIHMEGVNIIAITYGSTAECPYPRHLKYPSRWSFNSRTVLKSSEQALRMLPMTEDILGDDTGMGGDDVKPPEKSFWAKYWMYLVPLGLIIMNAVTQAMNIPEEQTAGQASAAGQAPAGQASLQGTQRVANSGVRRR